MIVVLQEIVVVKIPVVMVCVSPHAAIAPDALALIAGNVGLVQGIVKASHLALVRASTYVTNMIVHVHAVTKYETGSAALLPLVLLLVAPPVVVLLLVALAVVLLVLLLVAPPLVVLLLVVPLVAHPLAAPPPVPPSHARMVILW